MTWVVGLALKLVERGWAPDAFVRWGIRRLHRQRLRDQAAVGTAARDQALAKFVDAMKAGPIAPVPEKANEQHYEVPAAFFERVLGGHLKYSGCYWVDGCQSLDEAEAAMLELTCARADIEDGQTILELGCGWGSLSLWMAEQFPRARITAVSNSASQRVFIEGRCRARGLNNLTVVTADMNDFDTEQAFDRVVSVEMFEHMRNYAALMERIARWLRPDGKLFVHIFCHRDYAYEFLSEGDDNWMGRYFFTGGIMPSADLLGHFQGALQLDEQWMVGGEHYAQTAEAWLENLDRKRDAVMPVLAACYGADAAKLWFVRWRLFFLACAELFAYRRGTEWRVGHYRFKARDEQREAAAARQGAMTASR